MKWPQNFQRSRPFWPSSPQRPAQRSAHSADSDAWRPTFGARWGKIGWTASLSCALSALMGTKLLLTVWTRLLTLSDSATEGKTFSFNNFLILTRLIAWVDLSIEFIEYARFENNCFWSYNSFSRRENCEPFCFSCNLSSFISKFQRLHIRALCNFFGQEDRRPPKSECARTPMQACSRETQGNCWQKALLGNAKNGD